MHWNQFEFDGKIYDLTHLHPRTLSFMQPASGRNPPRVYRVEVIYSLHCFTRGGDGEVVDAAMYYSDSRETRIFDFDRYELSHQLPCIIGGLAARTCFHAERANYFTIEIQKGQSTLEYEVYFTCRARQSKARLICLSRAHTFATRRIRTISRRESPSVSTSSCTTR